MHPAMLAHPNPENVAILCGGGGGALREVLKHNTVNDVKFVEIDEMVVDVAKKHLPDLSNCTDVVGSADSCFDDPRASTIISDAVDYIIQNKDSESFDVIILDGLDPEDLSGQSKDLYNNENFIAGLFETLSDEGVLVAQLGTSPGLHDPAPHLGAFATRETFFKILETHAAAMFVYDLPAGGYVEPISIVIACKSSSCRQRWYQGINEIDSEIYRRIPLGKNGKSSIDYYDGSTHALYQEIPKAWETIYCRRIPTPYECAYRGLDWTKPIYELKDDSGRANFSVKKNAAGENSLFADVLIERGSYILPEYTASPFVISDRMLKILESTHEEVNGVNSVHERVFSHIVKNSRKSFLNGLDENIMDTGLISLVRRVDAPELANVGKITVFPNEMPPYSPVFERRRHSFDTFLVATKDIQADQELLNYNR